ncbi:MAG: bifunctional UDP-N-acetylglucosamine diphosphorylase/glucosamine-1-phosphate N-acetyltransferase GlmU [Candidatus Berkiella sp.]
MPLSIVILAAGQGTRMKSSIPKVLHSLGGQPLLGHVLSQAEALKPSQIIVVCGYGADVLKHYFPSSAITWALQPERLGTGDAVAKALPLISDNNNVLILYGDVPLIQQSTLQKLMDNTHDSLGILTANMGNPTGLGRIIRDNEGKVLRIVEEKDATESQKAIKEINTGIVFSKAAALKKWVGKLTNDNAQKEYYLTDIVQFAVADNVNVATEFPAEIPEIIGINDKFQLAQLERHYQWQQSNLLLQKGATLVDPGRFDLRGGIEFGSDLFIDVNVIFEGYNRLGSGCYIGPNCVLINCDLGDNVTVLANSHLEGATIGNGSRVGPFARLRPGAILADNAHVGNYVEIKNSFIGEGSKINHLSYIGDTTMGSNVNVGAGTITCNYDGANKHETIIEDDVQIGSDTQLIAPVRVGKGATLGAGSTVTQDVPSYQLTLTHRLEPRSMDWQRPVKQQKAPKDEK